MKTFEYWLMEYNPALSKKLDGQNLSMHELIAVEIAKNAYRAGGEFAESELTKPAETCLWRLEEDDYSLWEGACGVAWQFSNDCGIEENGMNYCPRCGKPIEVEDV